jgi:hypothetical protein
MQIPLEDYRKNAVSLILAPYLINIRKISPDQSVKSISDRMAWALQRSAKA